MRSHWIDPPLNYSRPHVLEVPHSARALGADGAAGAPCAGQRGGAKRGEPGTLEDAMAPAAKRICASGASLSEQPREVRILILT